MDGELANPCRHPIASRRTKGNSRLEVATGFFRCTLRELSDFSKETDVLVDRRSSMDRIRSATLPAPGPDFSATAGGEFVIADTEFPAYACWKSLHSMVVIDGSSGNFWRIEEVLEFASGFGAWSIK